MAGPICPLVSALSPLVMTDHAGLKRLNYPLFLLILLLLGGAIYLALQRLTIETDVLRTLPTDEKVIRDALTIFNHHPIHDRVAIDITLNRDEAAVLMACGAMVEERLRASALFSQVGMEQTASLIPELATDLLPRLPTLFSAHELTDQVVPRLAKSWQHQRLAELTSSLNTLAGIGQAHFIAADPLGLKDLVMARLALLAPSQKANFVNGHLLSQDGRHLLVTARPKTAGTDTTMAAEIAALLNHIQIDLQRQYGAGGITVTMTPVGAYRAALDNERLIRRDVQLALGLATLGIAVLLIFSFPRPWLGLLSLVPALAGSAAALLLYSLFFPSISIMVLGFGGALISITVDQGIAYLLFLDRPVATKGQEAAHEVKAVGLMAVLTSVGAFLLLSLSDFPIFVELGRFTALGILFAFLFVHLVLPYLLPSLPPGRPRPLPLRHLVARLAGLGKGGAWAGLALFVVMLFFCRPEFLVSLQSMNTVSQETRQANALFTRVWGDSGKQVYLLASAASPVARQRENDRLLQQLSRDKGRHIIKAAFVPALLFPGPEIQARNLAAWREFWGHGRAEGQVAQLRQLGLGAGFNATAFGEFYRLLAPDYQPPPPILPPARFHELLGMGDDDAGGQFTQFITVVPGPDFNATSFARRYSRAAFFSGKYFSDKLAGLLFHTFSSMLGIIALAITLLLLCFYGNIALLLLTMAPVVFAYVCTLGTLKIMGQPLDIPALMLSIVILGMGVDYSIFYVRAYQRYRDEQHPYLELVRNTIFLAAASTLIGFGVLIFAGHSLLYSIGLTSFLGIAYSLAGAFLFLPPLLHWYFGQPGRCFAHLSLWQRVWRRYRLLELWPRLLTRWQLWVDPFWRQLPALLTEAAGGQVRTVVDLDCGFGLGPAILLAHFPAEVRLWGQAGQAEQLRVVSLLVAKQGVIGQGRLPVVPEVDTGVDLVIYGGRNRIFARDELLAIFGRCREMLAAEGRLLWRCSTAALADIEEVLAEADMAIAARLSCGRRGQEILLVLVVD